MEYLKEVNDRFSVSLSHPDIDDFERLVASGYSAVVNLRENEEPGQALTPKREHEVAAKLGMLYSHLPVSPEGLTDRLVDEFREIVSGMPGKILVHSGTGNRSAAFTLMHIASEKGASGKEAIEQAQDLGFDWDSGNWSQFIQRYVDTHKADIHQV